MNTFVYIVADQPLSAADVAAALFMNADYLSRLFKNECGITLKEYILKISVEIFFNHTLERKHALSKKVASAI